MAYIQILEVLMTLVREKILYLVDGPNIVKWHDNGFHYLESIFHAAEDLQQSPEDQQYLIGVLQEQGVEFHPYPVSFEDWFCSRNLRGFWGL